MKNNSEFQFTSSELQLFFSLAFLVFFWWRIFSPRSRPFFRCWIRSSMDLRWMDRWRRRKDDAFTDSVGGNYFPPDNFFEYSIGKWMIRRNVGVNSVMQVRRKVTADDAKESCLLRDRGSGVWCQRWSCKERERRIKTRVLHSFCALREISIVILRYFTEKGATTVHWEKFAWWFWRVTFVIARIRQRGFTNFLYERFFFFTNDMWYIGILCICCRIWWKLVFPKLPIDRFYKFHRN